MDSQAAEIIGELDARGFIHGDISPNNIGWTTDSNEQLQQVYLFDLSTLRDPSKVRCLLGAVLSMKHSAIRA